MSAYGTDDNNAYSGGFANAYGANLSGDVGDNSTGKAYNTGLDDLDNSNVPNSNWMSVDDRLRDLEIREQRAIELEKELDEKEGRMKKQYKGYRPPKDWPCAKFAIARHNISKEIPSKHRNHVRRFYSLWWLVVLTICLNWLCIIWYGAYKKEDNFMTYILLPSLYMCVGCPLTWILWYKRYYKAMQNNGNISYMFFVFFGLQILWSGINTIGFISISSCGVLVMTQVWINDSKKQLVLALLMTITTFLWGLSCIVGIWMLRLAHGDLGRFLAKKYAPMAHDDAAQVKVRSSGSLN